MSSPSCLPMVTNVPPEIWHEILSFSNVEDLLMLEQTCHFFHKVIENRHFWLKRLQALDQTHAPDLPPHVPVGSLTYRNLRDLVVMARRRVLNCTGSSPLRISRETIIPIGQTNINGILGQPFGWGADTLLLPGGRYFLMKWPAGYLQCWDVPTKKCLWTYPNVPQDTSGPREVLAKCCFACDVQMNGDVHVAVVSEVPGDDQRMLKILRFSRMDNSFAVLFQIKPVELDVFHGFPVILKLYGDIVIVYTEGNVTTTLWRKNRSVVITDGIFDALEIVDDYIIGVTGSYDGNSLVAIPLSFIHSATMTHVQLADVPTFSCRITPPVFWLVGRAQLSICKFHWQENRRPKIAITVLGDVYNEQSCCDFPVAEFFSFDAGDFHASGAPNICPAFTHLGRSRFTDFEPQFSTYSVITPPSQAGSTVLASYDDGSHETRFARILATFMPDRQVAVRGLEDAVVGDKPATFSLNVEFYSGAVYYVTSDLKKVVIRYLD